MKKVLCQIYSQNVIAFDVIGMRLSFLYIYIYIYQICKKKKNIYISILKINLCVYEKCKNISKYCACALI